MNGLQRSSLRARVGALLALAIVFVAVALGSLVGQSSIDQLRERIGQSLTNDARRMTERLTSEMASRARELALLARLDPLHDNAALTPQPQASPPLPTPLEVLRVESMLDGLKRSVPYYLWIGVTDPGGRVMAATDQSSIGSDISARASVREGLRGRSPIEQTTRDERVMDLVHPIRGADGSVIGVIVAQLAWQWVNTVGKAVLASDDLRDEKRELFLVGRDDVVLIGPPGTVGRKLLLPAVARARAGFEGWSVETFPEAVGGGTYLTGAAYAGGEGAYPGPGSQEMRWTVLVREPVAAAFAPAYTLRVTILELGGALAAAFALLGWMIAGWITAPLKRIAIAAERLRQGDDVELPRLRGPAEIASLALSLRALVATLTRKQVALDEMEGLALTDPLTGLLNRNGLRRAMARAVAQARSDGSGLLVLVGDLDGFKAINDTFGHNGGDTLLRQLGQRVAGAVRPLDIVARLGGDEFVLALRAPAGGRDEAARRVAQRVLDVITQPYALDDQMVRVGCSLGGAVWPEHVDGDIFDQAAMDRVLAKADSALYAVKRTGKGRLKLYGDGALISAPLEAIGSALAS